jgi:plasmid stabilization system protein ParE
VAAVRWSLAAERDVQGIEEFIARDAPLRAVAFVDRLIESVAALAQTPRLGRAVPEFERSDLREVIFRGYRIVYLLDDEEITVLRVVHGARDLASLVEREPWDLR